MGFRLQTWFCGWEKSRVKVDAYQHAVLSSPMLFPQAWVFRRMPVTAGHRPFGYLAAKRMAELQISTMLH